MRTLEHLPKTQAQLIQRLKARGPQSIKILAAQLEMTTMGVRQHLAQLQSQDYVQHAQLSRQTRGRPVTLWKLTRQGHALFPDRHAEVAVSLLSAVSRTFGSDAVAQLIASDAETQLLRYRELLPDPSLSLKATLEALCAQRSAEGFMAELRFTPTGWLLSENHCPLFAAAKTCEAFCHEELALFRTLLEPHARVERSDHLLAGARRCAYRIQSLEEAEN